jgi:hypothetical protein
MWWKQRHWGWCAPDDVDSSSTHSTDSSTLIIRDWNNRPFSGLSNNGFGSTPQRELKEVPANTETKKDLFQTANGILPWGRITTTIHTSHIHNTNITYTQIHISHNIESKAIP